MKRTKFMKTSVSRALQHIGSYCRRPVAVIVVILGLTLGIAANTAVVNFAWGALVDALAGASPDRLLMVSERLPTGGNSPLIYSPADFEELRQWNVSFAEVAAYDQKYSVLGESHGAKSLLTTSVSAGFFALLDIQPEMGRFFVREDDRPESELVVILSHQLWKEHFHGDAKVVGASIILDKKSYQVVGVMPDGFHFPDQTALWVPLALGPRELDDGTSYYLNVLARLKPGVSLRQAQTELRGYMQRLGPQITPNIATRSVLLDPVYDHLKGRLETL